MSKPANNQHRHILWHLLYWSVLVFPLAISVGSLVALFLWLLDVVTVFRWANLWLIFLLPVAGVLIVWVYEKFGGVAARGNDLIMDEIHSPGGGVPPRMAPLILITTLVTHLFGGSAGREGTAVQMGGSIAATIDRFYKLGKDDQRILLMCGVSAGFGAVFGTPVAAAIFAMEVLTVGKLKYNALLPCLIASVLADITCTSYGIVHTRYQVAFVNTPDRWVPWVSLDLILLGKVIIAGVFFGAASYTFAKLTHGIKAGAARVVSNKLLTAMSGGVLVVGMSYAIGSFDYLGLGVTNPADGVSIISAFQPHGAGSWSWFWKLLLTAITLGSGFKGGEVTPLFFIGATLGNTLATVSGSPVDLFAALGFIAVFAGATNTPLACTLMGVELFGSENIVYFAVACFTAYYFSGSASIYSAQRKGTSKAGRETTSAITGAE
ncbi:voltage-gated chloride channel protein [Segetibacter sp. 3557_3]|uniref:voltage-gated chloride channel family protein n=1 Tax=Segetibacter sp. 3557_3 TaxID=2547429 RepID=UPI001058ADB3|nr:voltage-gated chloride channel family protein [Segetibacter sp. 3557_3]TDH21337.1 voltage-gated chloride channel protein [Segetibacter sp. 3557_3]